MREQQGGTMHNQEHNRIECRWKYDGAKLSCVWIDREDPEQDTTRIGMQTREVNRRVA